MDNNIKELEQQISTLQARLAEARADLKQARMDENPFKVGEEVEAFIHHPSRGVRAWLRVKIHAIDFRPAGPEYQVLFRKLDGTWSIKPRYTLEVRKLPND